MSHKSSTLASHIRLVGCVKVLALKISLHALSAFDEGVQPARDVLAGREVGVRVLVLRDQGVSDGFVDGAVFGLPNIVGVFEPEGLKSGCVCELHTFPLLFKSTQHAKTCQQET